MIYELSRDIEEALRALKYPVRIAYDPRTRPEIPSSVIIFERDATKSDTIDTARGIEANPRKMRTRELAAVATIYVASSLRGAHLGDHQRECELLVDAVVIALVEWGVAMGAGVIPFPEARYLSAVELQGVYENWPGVAYILRFRVPRGLSKRQYVAPGVPGAARPEGEYAGTQNKLEVRRDGTTDTEIAP